MYEAHHIIERIASLAEMIAYQSGTASSELAGQMLSVLAANPALIDRFMVDGSEMFLEGEFAPERGSLSWYGQNGKIVTPQFMRAHRVVNDIKRKNRVK